MNVFVKYSLHERLLNISHLIAKRVKNQHINDCQCWYKIISANSVALAVMTTTMVIEKRKRINEAMSLKE